MCEKKHFTCKCPINRIKHVIKDDFHFNSEWAFLISQRDRDMEPDFGTSPCFFFVNFYFIICKIKHIIATIALFML